MAGAGEPEVIGKGTGSPVPDLSGNHGIHQVRLAITVSIAMWHCVRA
jgi:hypothetical protein